LFAKIDKMKCAIVCDDDPLMYAIPAHERLRLGGTNEVTDISRSRSCSDESDCSECAQVLKMESPRVLRSASVSAVRKSGVRLEAGKLSDGRTVIHNYGHGGSGFTLSWGLRRKCF